MGKLEKLTEQFREKWERFLIGCDAVEEEGSWDLDTLGEMDAYYENDLSGIAIRLIASDGKISEEEVQYLNQNFGYRHSVDRLTEIYRNCRENFGEDFIETFQGNIRFLETSNKKLAAAYRELVGLICDIIVASDRVIADEEKQEIDRIRKVCAD